jgi:hypothetical protein
MGRRCGAASKCVQCLVAHVPPFSWVFQGLSDKKFDWQFVLVAQIPCGLSPDSIFVTHLTNTTSLQTLSTIA